MIAEKENNRTNHNCYVVKEEFYFHLLHDPKNFLKKRPTHE